MALNGVRAPKASRGHAVPRRTTGSGGNIVDWLNQVVGMILRSVAIGWIHARMDGITYPLHRADVSRRYYVFEGNELDCEDDEAMTCVRVKQGQATWKAFSIRSDAQDPADLVDASAPEPLVNKSLPISQAKNPSILKPPCNLSH